MVRICPASWIGGLPSRVATTSTLVAWSRPIPANAVPASTAAQRAFTGTRPVWQVMRDADSSPPSSPWAPIPTIEVRNNRRLFIRMTPGVAPSPPAYDAPLSRAEDLFADPHGIGVRPLIGGDLGDDPEEQGEGLRHRAGIVGLSVQGPRIIQVPPPVFGGIPDPVG